MKTDEVPADACDRTGVHPVSIILLLSGEINFACVIPVPDTSDSSG